jgi:hypothetical protein
MATAQSVEQPAASLFDRDILLTFSRPEQFCQYWPFLLHLGCQSELCLDRRIQLAVGGVHRHACACLILLHNPVPLVEVEGAAEHRGNYT